MKILVLGSEGFIGKHLVRFFVAGNLEVSGADLLDVKNSPYTYYKVSRFQSGFDQIFETGNFQVCINAAGSGSVPMSFTNTVNDFESNTVDVFNILESIKRYSPHCRYINISSAAVYGNPRRLPINEKDEVHPLSPYGWHKYYSELLCREYHALYGVRCCSVRPFSVYGPGLQKQLFWDIFQKIRRKSTLVLFGTGNESRDFIYISDLVRAIHLISVKAAFKGEVINIATGTETTIRDAAVSFCKLIDPSIQVSFNGITKEGDPLNWQADISVLQQLGFSEDILIKDGLKEVVQWLKEKK